VELRHHLASAEFGTCLGIKTALSSDEWRQRADGIIKGWEETSIVPDPDNWDEDGTQVGSNAMGDLQPITPTDVCCCVESWGFVIS
jgi:hypothetical protein